MLLTEPIRLFTSEPDHSDKKLKAILPLVLLYMLTTHVHKKTFLLCLCSATHAQKTELFFVRSSF